MSTKSKASKSLQRDTVQVSMQSKPPTKEESEKILKEQVSNKFKQQIGYKHVPEGYGYYLLKNKLIKDCGSFYCVKCNRRIGNESECVEFKGENDYVKYNDNNCRRLCCCIYKTLVQGHRSGKLRNKAIRNYFGRRLDNKTDEFIGKLLNSGKIRVEGLETVIKSGGSNNLLRLYCAHCGKGGKHLSQCEKKPLCIMTELDQPLPIDTAQVLPYYKPSFQLVAKDPNADLHHLMTKIYGTRDYLNRGRYDVSIDIIMKYTTINNNDTISIPTTKMSYQQLLDYLEYIRKLQLEENPHARRHLIKDIEREFKIFAADWGIDLFVAEEAIIETLLTVIKNKSTILGNKGQYHINETLPYVFTYTKDEFYNLLDLLKFNKDLLDFDEIIKYITKIKLIQTINSINAGINVSMDMSVEQLKKIKNDYLSVQRKKSYLANMDIDIPKIDDLDTVYNDAQYIKKPWEATIYDKMLSKQWNDEQMNHKLQLLYNRVYGLSNEENNAISDKVQKEWEDKMKVSGLKNLYYYHLKQSWSKKPSVSQTFSANEYGDDIHAKYFENYCEQLDGLNQIKTYLTGTEYHDEMIQIETEMTGTKYGNLMKICSKYQKELLPKIITDKLLELYDMTYRTSFVDYDKKLQRDLKGNAYKCGTPTGKMYLEHVDQFIPDLGNCITKQCTSSYGGNSKHVNININDVNIAIIGEICRYAVGYPISKQHDIIIKLTEQITIVQDKLLDKELALVEFECTKQNYMYQWGPILDMDFVNKLLRNELDNMGLFEPNDAVNIPHTIKLTSGPTVNFKASLAPNYTSEIKGMCYNILIDKVKNALNPPNFGSHWIRLFVSNIYHRNPNLTHKCRLQSIYTNIKYCPDEKWTAFIDKVKDIDDWIAEQYDHLMFMNLNYMYDKTTNGKASSNYIKLQREWEDRMKTSKLRYIYEYHHKISWSLDIAKHPNLKNFNFNSSCELPNDKNMHNYKLFYEISEKISKLPKIRVNFQSGENIYAQIEKYINNFVPLIKDIAIELSDISIDVNGKTRLGISTIYLETRQKLSDDIKALLPKFYETQDLQFYDNDNKNINVTYQSFERDYLRHLSKLINCKCHGCTTGKCKGLLKCLKDKLEYVELKAGIDYKQMYLKLKNKIFH